MLRQFYQWVIVRRPPGTRYLQRYVLKTIKHPTSILIWDCISRNGRSQLKLYETAVHVNGEIYEHLIRESCFKAKCYNIRLIYLCMTMLLVKERVEFADCLGRKIFRYGNWIGQETVRISTPIENV